MKTLLEVSSADVGQGLRTFGELISSFTLKHSMPIVLAQAFTIYCLMADGEHKKGAMVQLFFEAYCQLQDVEVDEFLRSCDSGIDLETLKMLQMSGGPAELWRSPGAARLSPSEHPQFFEFEMERL